jgi:protein O-mannosyl-transferase
MAVPTESCQNTLSPLLIAFVAFFLYVRTTGFDFVYDDVEHILNNPAIFNFTPSQFWVLLWQPWRAMPQITYGLSYYAFGFNSGIFHLTNVLLHVFNSILVYGIARTLAKKWLPADRVDVCALAAGMIFAVHPLHSEAVAYVWARSSSLCALFYFGSLLMFSAGLSVTGRKRLVWFVGALIAGFLAWKAKEESITLPLVAAGLAALQGSWRTAAGMAFVPLVPVAAQWRSLVQLRSVMTENPILAAGGFERALDPLPYCLTSLKGAVFYYLRLYVCPLGQSADPYLKPVSGFLDLSLLLAIAFLSVFLSDIRRLFG